MMFTDTLEILKLDILSICKMDGRWMDDWIDVRLSLKSFSYKQVPNINPSVTLPASGIQPVTHILVVQSANTGPAGPASSYKNHADLQQTTKPKSSST